MKKIFSYLIWQHWFPVITGTRRVLSPSQEGPSASPTEAVAWRTHARQAGALHRHCSKPKQAPRATRSPTAKLRLKKSQFLDVEAKALLRAGSLPGHCRATAGAPRACKLLPVICTGSVIKSCRWLLFGFRPTGPPVNRKH